MSERTPISASGYRFGFGGQEADNEVHNNANMYTAEYWEYDARLGRRWNVDPVVKPWESSYAAFSNNPIYYNDPNGLNASGTIGNWLKKIWNKIKGAKYGTYGHANKKDKKNKKNPANEGSEKSPDKDEPTDKNAPKEPSDDSSNDNGKGSGTETDRSDQSKINGRKEIVLFRYWKRFRTLDETGNSTPNGDGSVTYTATFRQSGDILVRYNHDLMGVTNLPGAGPNFNGNITNLNYGNNPGSSGATPSGGPGMFIVPGATNNRGNPAASQGVLTVWSVPMLNNVPTGDQFTVHLYYRKEVKISVPTFNSNGNGLFSRKNKNRCTF